MKGRRGGGKASNRSALKRMAEDLAQNGRRIEPTVGHKRVPKGLHVATPADAAAAIRRHNAGQR